MNDGLLDLLSRSKGPSADRVYGVAVGIVTNNKDPEGMGRVKVRFPWLSDEDESWWARIAAPMAGNDRGAYFLPEVEDEVLVAFEHGDIRFPYVVGALWNGVDKPPENNKDGKNNFRTIKSRSGHVVRLDDTNGAEKIEVIDKSGDNSIVIDTADNSITIRAEGGITMESKQGTVAIKGRSVEVESQTNISVDATANMDLTAGPALSVKGGIVKIN